MPVRMYTKYADIDDPNWKLPFGKYRGQTIEHVIKTDVSYVRWAMSQDVISFSGSTTLRKLIKTFEMNDLLEATRQKSVSPKRNQVYTGDNRNAGGGYGVWDDAGCYPGDPSDYGY